MELRVLSDSPTSKLVRAVSKEEEGRGWSKLGPKRRWDIEVGRRFGMRGSLKVEAKNIFVGLWYLYTRPYLV